MYRLAILTLLSLGVFVTDLPGEPLALPPAVHENILDRISEELCHSLAITLLDEGNTKTVTYGDAREESIFEIGSITKVFTALLLADMARSNEVGFDDTIAHHLPDTLTLKPSTGAITLRQLAQHNSGLPRLPDNFTPANPLDPYADFTAAKLFSFLGRFEAPSPLPASYAYSNLGSGLLGHILSRVANKPYGDLLSERICRPLSMGDTTIVLDENQRNRLLPGHMGSSVVVPWKFDCLAGCGALKSTIVDMSRLAAACIDSANTPLGKTIAMTRQHRIATPSPDMHIELGWHVHTRHDTELVWHNGGTFGFHSFLGFRPREKRAVVVLSNTNEDIDDIGLHLLEEEWPLKRVKKAVALPLSQLQSYVGCYETAQKLRFDVKLVDGSLQVKLTGQSYLPIYAESKRTFFYRAVEATITFIVDEQGRVEGLRLNQGNIAMEARKRPPNKE